MDGKEFQSSLFDALQLRTLNLLVDHLDYLETDGTPDQKQKFIEWSVKTMGAEAEKKSAGNGLATVVVNIGLTGTVSVAVEAAPAEPVDLVETVEAKVLEPSPTAKYDLEVSGDLEGLEC